MTLTATVLRTAIIVGAAFATTAAGQTAPSAPQGYLPQSDIQALADTVPPAPSEGSAEAVADVAASDRMRSLENSDRWLLATRHAELRPAMALSHFDCALGFRVVAEDAPTLVGLLGKVLQDANSAAERAKARAFRPRPVGVDSGRPACVILTAAGRASPSYPSGSAAVGAAYGATLATLAPDRAREVLEIGHQIGISRLVCAMHYASDVTAGEALGQATFEAAAATPALQSELAAARQELDHARAAGLTSPACAAERAALSIPLP